MLRNIILIIAIILLIFFMSNDVKLNNLFEKKNIKYLFLLIIIYFIYQGYNLLILLIIIFFIVFLYTDLKDRIFKSSYLNKYEFFKDVKIIINDYVKSKNINYEFFNNNDDYDVKPFINKNNKVDEENIINNNINDNINDNDENKIVNEPFKSEVIKIKDLYENIKLNIKKIA